MIRRLIDIDYNNSFFIFGARGTGKSTYINDQFLKDQKISTDQILYIDLMYHVHRHIEKKKHHFVLMGSSA